MKWNRPLLRLLLALLTGVFLWLGWPERGFTPVLFVAFVPLLFVEADLAHHGARRAGLQFFLYSLLAMVAWNGATTWWIYYSTHEGAVFAILFNAVLMTVVLFLFHRMRRSFGPLPGYASFVIFWLAFEYLHLRWELSWPWLTLGNAFAVRTTWVQWYEYTGTLGGSCWILVVNLMAYLLVKGLGRSAGRSIRLINASVTGGGVLLLIFVPILLSKFIYARRADTGRPCRIVVVQPNIDPYNEKFNGTSDAQLDRFLRLAASAADTSTDFLVGPETALPDGMWENEMYYHPQIRRLVTFLDHYPHATLVTGLSSFKAYEKGETLSPTARSFADGSGYYDAYNSALLLDRFGGLQVYHKSRLVPGVEKMPYPAVFGFLEKYALKLGGISGSLGTQKTRNALVGPDGTSVAPAICYESVYGDFLSVYFRKGAELLVVMTNDGWWGNTPGYRQHFEYARLRAIEFRKCVARAANTGLSGFIDQRGNVLMKTGWWQPAALSDTLLLNHRVTFYARYGDYAGFIAAFLSAALLLLMVFRSFVSLN
jgi:apolipoprotein N-acyltransferase